MTSPYQFSGGGSGGGGGGGGLTAEEVDDRVATLLQPGPSTTLTYNDATNTLTIDGQQVYVQLTRPAPTTRPWAWWQKSADGTQVVDLLLFDGVP